MNRRDFMAGVIAWMNVKALPAVGKEPAPVRFAPLYNAYYESCYGRAQPNRMIVSTRLYEGITQRILQESILSRKEVAIWKFMNATLVADPYMSDETVWFQNSEDPFNPHLNKIISLSGAV